MGEISASSADGRGRLTLSGDFTVQHADQLRTALHAALLDAQELDLDISGVESVDVTFFQLLESLFKTAGTVGKAVAVSGDISQSVLKIAAELGLSHGNARVADVLAR